MDWFGWRATFFVVVPFCLASLYMARKFIPSSMSDGTALPTKPTLEWRGLLSLHKGHLVPTLVLLGSAALALLVFVKWQRRLGHAHRGPHQQAPLMNLALFKHRQFVMGSLVSFIYGTALFGSTYLVPLYLQIGLGV